MNTAIQSSLIENARSFLVEALTKAISAEKNSQEWKFAMLHLVQAIELSLKEMLRSQHPVLIYRNVDNPDHTVSLDQALVRLKRVANFEPSNDETTALKFASMVRNAIVHHEWKAEPTELKLAFGRLFGFLVDFHREHLESRIDKFIPRKLWLDGIKINDYGQELFRRAQERLVKEDLDDRQFVIECPWCGWRALPGFGDHAEQCYVCGHSVPLILCEKCQRLDIRGDGRTIGHKEYCFSCSQYLPVDCWHKMQEENG